MVLVVNKVGFAECVGPIEAPAIGTSTRRTSASVRLTVTGVKFVGVCVRAVLRTITRKITATMTLAAVLVISEQLLGEVALKLPVVQPVAVGLKLVPLEVTSVSIATVMTVLSARVV